MLCLESECSNWGRLTAWDSLISRCDQGKGNQSLPLVCLRMRGGSRVMTLVRGIIE